MQFKQVGIDSFPVETEKGFWIETSCEVSLSTVLEKVQEKWPGVSLDDVSIEAVNHHQYATGYDLHCPGDYVQYLYIEKIA